MGTWTPPVLTALTTASRWRMTPLDGAPAAMTTADLTAAASVTTTCSGRSSEPQGSNLLASFLTTIRASRQHYRDIWSSSMGNRIHNSSIIV